MNQEPSFLSSLLPKLSEFEDFRVLRNKLYPLNEILFLTISAVISGCKHWEEIADFGEEKLLWLRNYLPFEAGSPSHDTLNRVFSNLDYRAFESCFIDWVSQGLLIKEGTIINFDGKKVSRSASKQEQQTAHAQGGKSAVHLVQAWCKEFQVCLGQYKTADKSNEIIAIPALLDLLELKGAIVTIDAMGCQKKITQKIVDHQADYLIGMKANQKNLLTKTQELFAEADTELIHDWNTKGHGRIERRVCRVLPACLLGEELQQQWAGLTSLVEISSERKVVASGKVSHERRFYISSLDVSPEKFNQIVRGHWAIENQLHWSLDVHFREDYSTKQKKNAAQNFGLILRMPINLLKTNTDKMSVNRKLLKCARSDQYRQKIMRI